MIRLARIGSDLGLLASSEPGSCDAMRAHGVVVSHPLSMREALGSIPSVSTLLFTFGLAKRVCTNICAVIGVEMNRGMAIKVKACLFSSWRVTQYTPGQDRTGDLQRVRLTS